MIVSVRTNLMATPRTLSTFSPRYSDITLILTYRSCQYEKSSPIEIGTDDVTGINAADLVWYSLSQVPALT